MEKLTKMEIERFEKMFKSHKAFEILQSECTEYGIREITNILGDNELVVIEQNNLNEPFQMCKSLADFEDGLELLIILFS